MNALLAALLALVQAEPRAAEGWSLELVARAPRIHHPSVVCCAPDGRIFVGEDPIDMEGPIDARIDRVLCLHPDGRTTVFADGLGPVFGLMYLEGRLYVQHVPKLSVFRDVDGVGRDREDLLECTNPTPCAGNGLNDHIPANFHLGMDGYFYVAVGQKGIYGAVGRDGRRFEMREGGILRLRPDATGLEVFAHGVRNILDVAINSEEELFAYDNDDHTKTWKVKLLHLVDGGYYGFPYDFKPARRYTLGGIAEYKSGAPTGILAYTEDALPAEYRDNLILCDWARRTVFRVRVVREGATYRVTGQEDLIPPGPDDFRPVGITTMPDGLGFYVTDWNFAGWKRKKDDAGRLYKLAWRGVSRAAAKPDWYAAAARGEKVDASVESLTKALAHPSRSVRIAARRKLGPPAAAELPVGLLEHPDAATRFKAATALGRRGDKTMVPALLGALQDEDAVVRHGAFTALHRIGVADPSAWPAIASGLRYGHPRVREGTLYALREAYEHDVVSAIASFVDSAPEDLRLEAVRILGSLLRKPPPWDGRWWRNGPYAFAEDDPKVGPRIDRTVEWAGTELALRTLRKALTDESSAIREAAAAAVEAPALGSPNVREARADFVPPSPSTAGVDPSPYAEFASRNKGDAAHGRILFADPKTGCARCHRIHGQGGDIGPDLTGIGTKYGRPSLIESVLYPSRQIAEGYSQTQVRMRDGGVIAGLVRSETAEELVLIDSEGRAHRLRKADVDARRLSERSLMPDGLQIALRLEDFADLIAFLESLQDSEGFVPLFNGKDLTGWKKEAAHEGHWVVQDGGVLHYDAKGPDLWTEKSYANFILKADFRFPGPAVEKEAPVILPDGSVSRRTEKVLDAGDSGIFLRGSQKSQVNLWCWPIGSGEIYGYRTDGSLPAEVRKAATPKLRADKPPGEWNHLQITIRGEILTVVLNDKTVIEDARLPGIPLKGPIGLQHPGKPLTPDLPVEFANFLLKELP
ncbi:MAG TPA: family 16 glycoside hydrolase [Planctomycetota bacterium]|nr:family 16 glycoside hydrolase [Planctomycetota bacterium]